MHRGLYALCLGAACTVAVTTADAKSVYFTGHDEHHVMTLTGSFFGYDTDLDGFLETSELRAFSIAFGNFYGGSGGFRIAVDSQSLNAGDTFNVVYDINGGTIVDMSFASQQVMPCASTPFGPIDSSTTVQSGASFTSSSGTFPAGSVTGYRAVDYDLYSEACSDFWMEPLSATTVTLSNLVTSPLPGGLALMLGAGGVAFAVTAKSRRRRHPG